MPERVQASCPTTTLPARAYTAGMTLTPGVVLSSLLAMAPAGYTPAVPATPSAAPTPASAVAAQPRAASAAAGPQARLFEGSFTRDYTGNAAERVVTVRVSEDIVTLGPNGGATIPFRARLDYIMPAGQTRFTHLFTDEGIRRVEPFGLSPVNAYCHSEIQLLGAVDGGVLRLRAQGRVTCSAIVPE